jgi:ATP-dependent helicase/nuclease subunit A
MVGGGRGVTEAPLTAAQKRQWRASDPAASAWVVANAGAGKTHVLTQRVVRLLLDGADPGSILCVTFTKAAAAEMAGRIFGTLAAWALLDDDALAKELETKVQGRAPSAAQLQRARRLFARALETPGGLKIQTIHALCERLLQQFPFEANVPGRFEVLDDVAAASLMAEARAQVLAAARDETTSLGAAMRRLALTEADQTIDAALAAFVGHREAISVWLTRAGGAHPRARSEVDEAIADLRRRFRLAPDATAESMCRQICSAAGWAVSDCEGLCEELRQAIGADANRNDGYAVTALERIVRVGEADLNGGADARIAFFLSRNGGELRARQASRRFGATFRAGAPGLDGNFEAEAARLLALAEQLAAARTVEATEALLTVGDAILQRYREAKNRRGALDYDDLIVRTGNLLARSEAAQWVLYKLDAGLDHILVDEAQDTSPAQWAIIAALAGDFFAGETAAPRQRTVFAVGDDKQSIFSFQGAAPRIVAEMERHFRRQAEGAGQRFETVPLGLSFRSTKEVLDAVDQVFADEELSRSVTSGEYEEHTANRADKPGRVVVWPRVVRPDVEQPEDWTTPLDAPTAAEERLARDIAAEIGGLLGEPLPSGKRLTPAGVLILTRKRGSFAAAMNRALKEAGLPTAGSDRVAVSSHIAVLDLMALGDVMLLPQDDLQLAACLKSPLFGLDDDDLLARAAGVILPHEVGEGDRAQHGGGGGSKGEAVAAPSTAFGGPPPPLRGGGTLRRAGLWSRLADSGEERHRAAFERLRTWRGRADRETPFRFFARILGPEGGRRAMRARLGPEVDEVLDAFLSQAQAYERSGPPSLQGFLAAMRAATGDLKREAEEARAIRVMTVHGAKGLEVDCVFLVDTGSQIVHTSHRDPLIALPGSHAEEPAAFFWRRGNSDATAEQRRRDQEADAAATDEYRRLLYVGMTRARDVLHVCGIKPKSPPKRCWYELVRDALVPEEAPRGEDGELAGRFVWPPDERPALPPEAAKADTEAATPARPAWLDRPAPPPPAAPEPLRPSQALAEPDAPEPGAAPAALSPEAIAAMRRGAAIHRLLQYLPQVAPAIRPAAAARLMAGEAADEAAREALAAEALAVIDLPELAEAFGPHGRSEVPLVGLLDTARGRFAVSGQIDRLLISAGEIHLIDFKTDRAVPASLAEVAESYVRQLALYRALLVRLDPARAVRASLVWTAAPRVMEVPAAAMDRALVPLGIAPGRA